MVLNDRSESVSVHPGCSLQLFMHGPRFSAGAGTVHTFTHDDGSTEMPENDNFNLVGLANVVSSWECTCGYPAEHPIACGENEPNCDYSYEGQDTLAVYTGYVIDSIEVNGEVYGPVNRGSRIDVPLQPREKVLRLEYGINSNWEGKERDL